MEKSNTYIKGLDGLRAVAATVVFAYHTWGHWNYPTLTLDVLGARFDMTWLFHYGTEGVSIFFVLSGFLLSQPFWKAILNAGRPVDLREFFKRRFFRIYPAYLVALVVFALFYDNKDAISPRLAYFFTHLFLIHNLFELTIFRDASPLWSVASEFQMYLLLPLIFGAFGLYVKRKGRPAIAAAIFFVVTGLVALQFFRLAEAITPSLGISADIVRAGGEVIPHLPIIGLTYFGSGIAFGYVYQWIRRRRESGLPWHPLAPEFAGVTAVLLIVPVAMTVPDLIAPSAATWPRLAFCYGLLVAAVALGGEVPGITRLLEWAPIRYVGMISYSVYLYHDFMLHLAFHAPFQMSLGPLTDGTLKALLAFGMTLVVSTLSYYLIEKRFHGARKPTAQPSPALPVEDVQAAEPAGRSRTVNPAE